MSLKSLASLLSVSQAAVLAVSLITTGAHAAQVQRVEVRELSKRELRLMGISEESFSGSQQMALNPNWTIPTGEQNQPTKPVPGTPPQRPGQPGNGGQLPPCPKGVTPAAPTTQASPPFLPGNTTGPLFAKQGTSPLTAPAGCIPLPADPNAPANPTTPGTPNPTTPVGADPIPAAGGVIGTIGSTVVIVEHIVNIGINVWQFIKNGHAVVNTDMSSASMLPEGVTSAAQLEGWEPLTKNYKIIVPGTGKERQVEFVFRLTMWHNGSYRGVGSYIANLTVQAADYKVNWGQDFNVRARIPAEGLVNVSRISGQPIAAAQVLVEWSRGKTWSTHGNSAVIYVRGDGQVKNLSAPDEEPEDLYPIGKGSSSRR